MNIIKKGVVLAPTDLSWSGWIGAMHEAGLNYLGLHGSLPDLLAFLQSPEGGALIDRAGRAGIAVNVELHALSELLPRERFGREPNLFRMDQQGCRTPDANLCVSNRDALSLVGQNAARIAATLRRFSPVDRFYLWPDDGRPWCHCPACRELSDSDQSLLYSNALCVALRSAVPGAGVAHLAYATTLDAPTQVRPERGVFLQFAPILRNLGKPIGDATSEVNREHVARLGRLCQLFGPEEAEVLEYWLDASMFSRWLRPAVRLPFAREVVDADLRFYASLGFRRFSTFGVYLDEEYVRMYGEPPIREYGEALSVIASRS